MAIENQTSDFSFVPDQEAPEGSAAGSDFAYLPDDTSVPVTGPTPVKNAILSMASAPDTPEDTYRSLQEQNLNSAKQLIDSGNEFQARLKVASDRQQRVMRQLNDMRGPQTPVISPETSKSLEDSYRALAARDLAEDAKTAAEYETVRRVQDDLTRGNTVEAKLTYNLLTRGNAEEIFSREAAKNLILAQAAERYAAEADDESWGGAVYNFLTDLIPTNYNFSRAGIVDGVGSIKNFFLSGTGLQTQGEELYRRYDDPKDLAEALSPGGVLDQSLRSNATTLGGYAPAKAEELLRSLAFQSDSDRMWANVWGLADAGTLALPEVGVLPWRTLKSVPGALTRMGARSAARDTVVDAWDTIVRDGVDASIKKSGLTGADVTEHMEMSSMSPGASTEHSVPLSVDVQSRIDVANEVLKTLPENVQATRATTPEEIAHAYEETAKGLQKRMGSSLKDYKFVYDDLTSNETKAFVKGTLPEQGNVVHAIEFTVGKKDGGGFATASAARAAATKRGLFDSDFVFDSVTREIKEIDPDFNITGYHGTADSFDVFDVSKGGTVTHADDSRLGSFFVSDPNVAHTYSVLSAEKKAVSLQEFTEASSKAREAAARLFDFETANADAVRMGDKAAVAKRKALQKASSDAEEVFNKIMAETSVSGQNIRPVKIRLKNPLVYDFAEQLTSGYSPDTYSEIIKKAKAEGHDGVILKNTNDAAGPAPNELFDPGREQELNSFNNHDVYVVFDPAENVKAPWDAVRIQRDVSGQYFIKNRVNVREDGFYTTPLNTPANGFLAGLRSDARRLDRNAQVKAVAGGQNAEKLQSALNHEIKKTLKGLPKQDKIYLDEIIRKGQNEDKWLSDAEFDKLYERVSGTVPSERVQNAYKTYQLINDIEYTLRNNEEYKQLVTSGHETVGINLGYGDARFDGSAVVNHSPSVPSERVLNVSDGVHYTAQNNPLTKTELDRLVDDGYVMVKTKDVVTLPDGVVVRNFLVRQGDLERRPLEKIQLGYRAGGHRMYTGKYFAKQATSGLQPDTGQEFLKNPNVFRTSNNPNRLRAWADVMNRAIRDAKAGILDPQHFDDNVFSVRPDLSFPDGDDFVKAVEAGHVDLDNAIEIVGDRELPSAYATTSSSVSRFVDETETGATGYYRTTGRMYNSRRGEHLLDESGEFAETIDPWDAMNKAIYNISRMSSLSAYKANVMQRFEKTYGRFLEIDNPSQASPQTLLNARVGANVPADLARRIRAEQAGAKRIMRFETDFEKNVRHAAQNFAKWVLGDAEGGARQVAHDAVYWLQKNNPVAALRSLAFDAKLGFFNVGQLFLQSSTMAASIALHGFGDTWRGMSTALPLISHTYAKGAENVLDVLAKRSWKAAQFSSEQEFKDFFRFVDRTGIMKVGNTHLAINDFGTNRVFGAAGAFDGVREMGRAFFYAGEQMNRAVASRLAYEQLKKEGLSIGSAAFRERFVGKVDDLTFNMIHESSAAFQHGLWSIPTQFWAYNVRMMDAMFGNGFTAAQKTRLLLSQLLFFGAGGIPAASLVSEIYKNRTGQTADIDSLFGAIDRGVVDEAIHATTGADVRFGERVGTGPFLTDTIKNLFGMSEYGDKSTAELVGGATASIGWRAASTLGDVIKYATAESGTGDGLQITKDNLLKMAMQISTLGNLTKGVIANQYGYYISSTGSVQATDLPRADGFFLAVGLGNPQELDDLQTMSAYLEGKEEVKKDATKQLRNWRQEAFTNPDKFDENMQKANTFVQLLPSEIRADVLKSVNNTTDSSFYEHVAKKFQRERIKEEMINAQ